METPHTEACENSFGCWAFMGLKKINMTLYLGKHKHQTK